MTEYILNVENESGDIKVDNKKITTEQVRRIMNVILTEETDNKQQLKDITHDQ